MYVHVRDWRYRIYEIRLTIATSAFWRTRRSRLAYTWTTGHVGGIDGRRLRSSGWYVSTLGMTWKVSRTVFHSWMLPLMGVEIALIDRVHKLFTYPNFSLIRMNFYSLLATGVRISEGLLYMKWLCCFTKSSSSKPCREIDSQTSRYIMFAPSKLVTACNTNVQ